jgi:citrate lyase subunit beta/citryl-CoA lyase
MAKVRSIACDAIIFDLEDAVAPELKETARRNLVEAFAAERFANHETVIRVNAIGSADFGKDLEVVARCHPNAFLVPKISLAEDFRFLSAAAVDRGVPHSIGLWVMIETAAALSNLDRLVAMGLAGQPKLDCLVVGTNDLAKETGVFSSDQRLFLLPWLMTVVLAAKRHGICVLDGVWNDFADQAGFDAEALQSVKMAFDGKTLIHPSQIVPANRAFSPSMTSVLEARAIVAAFAQEANVGAGVINMGGKMVERLHLEQARRVLTIHDAIEARSA